MLIAWIAKHRKTLVFEDKQGNVHDIGNQFNLTSKANKQTNDIKNITQGGNSKNSKLHMQLSSKGR